MKSSTLCAAMLLCAGMAMASAGRTWEPGLLESRLQGNSNMQLLKWLLSAKEDDDPNRGLKHYYMAIRYEVPPYMQDKFIDEWMRVEDKTRDERDCVVYDLKKTTGDNLHWYVYGQWKDWDAFYDHLTSDYVKDFSEWLEKNDIMFEMHPLEKITDDAQEMGGGGKKEVDRKGRGKRGEDERDMPAHVFITFHVPPSKTRDFVGTWEECAKATADEKENNIYGLRKVATMNHHYYVYGTWETFDAWFDHLNSDHVKKLRSFANDNNIFWTIEHMRMFGKESEM